jgi:hypothetical protein
MGKGQGITGGLQDAALLELRQAAATYDFLRAQGDPVEFWEALRLARNRRSVPPDGPAPDEPTRHAITQALEGVRERLMGMVAELRALLDGAPGIPEPGERFEMALAFLMASPREHEAVAAWLKEPERHRSKAADKLRSLAAITDPYREALKPWSLG